MTLVHLGFSFIPHLAHHFANFRRLLCKSLAANCTFLLAADRAVSSAYWVFSFVCGEVFTLYNVCSLHRGMFSTSRVFSTSGDTMSTSDGYHEYIGGYHEYIGGIS